ncbi:MAG: hypothetical protein RML56_00120 [Burkholderiales bacterium]|nr:hypothetical protein [Burkholderiales bacterium]
MRGESAWIEPEFEAQVRALPQIRACPSFIRSQRVILDPARPAVALACARRGGGCPLSPRRARVRTPRQ